MQAARQRLKASKDPIVRKCQKQFRNFKFREIIHRNCVNTRWRTCQRDVRKTTKPTNHHHQKITKYTLETNRMSTHTDPPVWSNMAFDLDEQTQGLPTKRLHGPPAKQIMTRADGQTTNIINVATRLPEVEKFSNGPSAEITFSEWKDNYELNCQALSIPRENWGKILPLYLTEGALITYRNIIARNPTIKEDYNILTSELAEKFAVTDEIANTVDLNNIVKHESESVGK